MSEKIQVAVVDYDGQKCTFPTFESFCEEMREFYHTGDDTEIRVTFKEMSQEDYDTLEEFQGW